MKFNNFRRPPLRSILNNNELDKNLIRRFARIDYPVYCIPMEITERSLEPYEEAEINMEKILSHTECSRKKLFEAMGITTLNNSVENILEYLMSIGHIEEKHGRLILTELGQKSLKENHKIKIDRNIRLIYFDALTSMPLPEKYYKKSEAIYINPLVFKKYGNSNFIDSWNDFNYDNLKKLLKMNGEERLKYNLPYEMTDIKVSDYILNLSKDEILSKEIIMYIPLYIFIYEDIDIFCQKIKMKNMVPDLNFIIYNAASGRRDIYFEEQFKSNFNDIFYKLIPFIQNFNAKDDKQTGIWQQKFSESETFNNLNISILDDENLILKIETKDIEQLIKDNNMQAIMDIANNNLIPIDDEKHHGRIVRIEADDNCVEMAVKYLLDKEGEQLKEHNLFEAI